MWPFSRNMKSRPVPSIRCGDILVTWDAHFGQWEFSDGTYDYTLDENSVFDPAVFARLEELKKWLQELDSAINAECKQYLDEWCEWTGEKSLASIDISWMLEKNEVKVTYADEDWGDLGIDIVIVDGRIQSSYAGD